MIRVESLGGEVLIGRGIIPALAGRVPAGRVFIVTDANVADAGWSGRVAEALGPRVLGTHVLAPGEATKSWRALEMLADVLLESGLRRTDHVAAVGGGVVGDLAGLAAALVKRGCGLIMVPTSLIAQADAAIGGKTAINARQGKNLIGTFHRPALVLADIDTLATLPKPELRAGYAEVVKYGLIADSAFFDYCERHGADLIAGDPDALVHAVATGIRIKADIVAQDERDESGIRARLNFGHSFAHAIETEAGIRHGEAVAIGMALAYRFAAERGDCAVADAARVAAHLAAAGLPVGTDKMDAARLVAVMAHDKKAVSSRLRLILPHRIGAVFSTEVKPAEVEAFLARS